MDKFYLDDQKSSIENQIANGNKHEICKLLKPRNNYDLIMKDFHNLFNLNNSDIPRKIKRKASLHRSVFLRARSLVM